MNLPNQTQDTIMEDALGSVVWLFIEEFTGRSQTSFTEDAVYGHITAIEESEEVSERTITIIAKKLARYELVKDHTLTELRAMLEQCVPSFGVSKEGKTVELYMSILTELYNQR